MAIELARPDHLALGGRHLLKIVVNLIECVIVEFAQIRHAHHSDAANVMPSLIRFAAYLLRTPCDGRVTDDAVTGDLFAVALVFLVYLAGCMPAPWWCHHVQRLSHTRRYSRRGRENF